MDRMARVVGFLGVHLLMGVGVAVAQCPAALGRLGTGGAARVDTATVIVGDAAVRVCYAAPSANGRNIFGHALHVDSTDMLVSYDSLWHTGVVLDVPAEVELAGVSLDPGSYGLFAIAGSYEWVIVVARNNGSFATSAVFDPATEVGRGLVQSSVAMNAADRLRVRGEVSGSSAADLVLTWGGTEVHVPLRLRETLGDLTCELRGQPERLAARSSPPDSTDFSLGEITARVCFGSPSARGRVVFGGVVPFDDMWRTGANEPTVLHLPVAAEVAGIPLAPGKYVLLTIPSRNEWVIVVNATTARWGRVTPLPSGSRSSYSSGVRSKEVGRALVPSGETDEHVEQFTITAEQVTANEVHLILAWERTRVSVPVRLRQ